MSEMSTPTVALDVKSTKAQLSGPSSLNLTGVNQAQPEWNTAVKAAADFTDTIFYYSDKGKANDLFNQLQQDMGDIERKYRVANGRGSREELQKVQNETNDLLAKYRDNLSKLDRRVRYEFTEKTDQYIVRFSDSIKNNAAKKAHDLITNNLAANVANASEDFAMVMDKPSDPNYKLFKENFEQALREKFDFDALDPSDPYYKQSHDAAVSALRKENAQYHIANKDYDSAWQSYWQGVKNKEFTNADRNNILAQLRNFEAQQQADLVKAQKEASKCMKSVYYGSATAECQDFFFATIRPSVERLVWAQYEADLDKYKEDKAKYDEWAKQNTGSVANMLSKGALGNVVAGSPMREPVPPRKPTFEDIDRETRLRGTETLSNNRERATLFGRTKMEVVDRIQALPVAQRPKDPMSLLMAVGYKTEDAMRIKEQIDENVDRPGDFWTKMSFGHAPDEAQQQPFVQAAENMPLAQWRAVEEAALAMQVEPWTLLARDWNLTNDNAMDVQIKWRNKLNGEVTQSAIELEDGLQKSVIRYLQANKASAMGGLDSKQVAAFFNQNNSRLKEIVAQSISKTISAYPELQNITYEKALNRINGNPKMYNSLLDFSTEDIKKWRAEVNNSSDTVDRAQSTGLAVPPSPYPYVMMGQ